MSAADEGRARLDIGDVIGDYVPLKRAGRIYKGLCPFHDERTPSFTVFPDSGNWRCFGACATGGDAFDFVMRIENADPATVDLEPREERRPRHDEKGPRSDEKGPTPDRRDPRAE